MSQQPRIQNFVKSDGLSTITLNAATTTGTKALRTRAIQLETDMLVKNGGTNPVAITWGDTAAAAVAVYPTTAAGVNAIVILPGATEVFYIGAALFVDAVTLTGNSLVYFTPGKGS